MREITRRISFGMGVPAQERTDHPVLDRSARGLRAAAQARAARGVAARHGRLGQPLREPDGGRGRPRLGRRPLRLARLRPQDGVGLPRARAGPARSTAGRRGRDGLAAGPVRGRLGARSRPTSRRCSSRATTRTPAATSSSAKVLEILGARGDARGAQPPQLRVAGGALRPHLLGDPQGLHAGASGPGGLRRRLDGRRLGHPRGRRARTRRAVALLDGARRRPGDEPHAGGGSRASAQALGVPRPRLPRVFDIDGISSAVGVPKKGSARTTRRPA